MENNYVDLEVREYLRQMAAEECSPEDKQGGENPIWELWQGVEKSRPFTSPDSEKKFFIRDE